MAYPKMRFLTCLNDIIIPHLGAGSGGEANVLRALWDAPNVYLETSLALLDESTGPAPVISSRDRTSAVR